MKQMPMFLMLLLATALSDGVRVQGAASAGKGKTTGTGAVGCSPEAGLDAWDEADLASSRIRKSAA
jgi:hypothetical protein